MTPQDYKQAKDFGTPPYVWLPPPEADLPLPTTPANLLRNVQVKPNCPKRAPGDFEGFPGEEHLEPQHPNILRIPHPLSDYTHTDPPPPEVLSSVNVAGLLAQSQHQRALTRLFEAAGPNAAGFQRLKLAFDWIVCNVSARVWAINEAIFGRGNYNDARDRYIAFVRNLDDHDPQTHRGAVNPQEGLGYGKITKWFSIDPIIEQIPDPRYPADPKRERPVITGATIIFKWNPHSSSSGVVLYP